MLGVLKAGAVYVPMDAAYGGERLPFQLRDTRAPVLLTRRRLLAELAPISRRETNGGSPADRLHGVEILCLEDGWEATGQRAEPTAPRTGSPLRGEAQGSHYLAYVVYTSGSTGTPKGVMVTHRGLVNAYRAWEQTYRLCAGDTGFRHADRHLQMASLSFDVFTGDLMRALGSGGTLVLCPRELLLDSAELLWLMRRERVGSAEFVPLVANHLASHLEENAGPLPLEDYRPLDFMRLLVVGSDSWYFRELAALARLCGPETRLVNSYGLSEATIDSTYFEASTADLHPDPSFRLSPSGDTGDRPVPVGRPFANSEIYLLDRWLKPVPLGVPGELHIGGAGLSRGYLNRPRRTALKLVPHPFSPVSGTRLYKTGDLARYLPDGNLEFLGRVDHQLKIRGFRVEPGEIEAVLGQHCGVRDAVVTARQEPTAGQSGKPTRLVAYVVFEHRVSSNKSEHAARLREHLRQRLPPYMVPSAFVLLETLPLLPSGKVDRDRLPAPEGNQSGPGEKFVAPRDSVEKALAEIWAEILGVEHVGIQDGFFALGGHSLLAVRLMARIEQFFQVKLPLATLFQESTVEGLAKMLGADR